MEMMYRQYFEDKRSKLLKANSQILINQKQCF